MYCKNCGELLEKSKDRCGRCGQTHDDPRRGFSLQIVLMLLVFVVGVYSIYLLGQVTPSDSPSEIARFGPGAAQPAISSEVRESYQPDRYQLPVRFGDIGPRLLATGAIDYDHFLMVFEQAGQPLAETLLAVLIEESDAPVEFNRENAYFLLNFLWALGLTNQNPILDKGPLMEYSEGDIGRFASTGGWTIGQRAATELYSSASLVSLTKEQQARLENVAYNVYRPCCNNHTAFADCNHGMAMLGLLELMAGEGVSEDEMFEAAKYVSSFWFPQQALETAAFLKATMGLDYNEVDGRMAVGPEVFSGSGFRSAHEWLASNGQLEQVPNSSSGCGV